MVVRPVLRTGSDTRVMLNKPKDSPLTASRHWLPLDIVISLEIIPFSSSLSALCPLQTDFSRRRYLPSSTSSESVGSLTFSLTRSLPHSLVKAKNTAGFVFNARFLLITHEVLATTILANVRLDHHMKYLSPIE